MTDLYRNLCCCVRKTKCRKLLVLQKGVDLLGRGAERYFPQGNDHDCPESAVLL